MRMISWTFTVIFALAGLTMWADHGHLLGPRLGDYATKGLFFLAILTCPFLWARSYGFLPRPLQIPAKQRMMLGLAMILAIPLVLPWY